MAEAVVPPAIRRPRNGRRRGDAARRSLRALAALAASFVLMLILGATALARKAGGPPGPQRGVVMTIWPDENKFALRTEDGSHKPVQLGRHDKIFINGEPRLIQE